jgi:hypothetical protein
MIAVLTPKTQTDKKSTVFFLPVLVYIQYLTI